VDRCASGGRRVITRSPPPTRSGAALAAPRSLRPCSTSSEGRYHARLTGGFYRPRRARAAPVPACVVTLEPMPAPSASDSLLYGPLDEGGSWFALVRPRRAKPRGWHHRSPARRGRKQRVGADPFRTEPDAECKSRRCRPRAQPRIAFCRARPTAQGQGALTAITVARRRILAT